MNLSWKALFGFSMLMILMIGQVAAQQQPMRPRSRCISETVSSIPITKML